MLTQLGDGWCTAHPAFPGSIPAKLSPQGSVRKARTEKRRRTSDWSFSPRGADGAAPNDAVDCTLLPPVRFPSTATYAKALAVLRAGRGDEDVYQCCVDIAHAYSNLAPLESELWQSQYISALGVITERRVPFGGRFAPNLYARLSALTVHVMNQAMDRLERNSPLAAARSEHWAARARVSTSHGRRYFISAYLDDYATAAVGRARALRAAMVVCAVLARSRLDLSPKTQGPSTFARHLGLCFDSAAGLVSCPPDKRDFLVNQAKEVV